MGTATPVGQTIRVGHADFRIDGSDSNHKRLYWDAGDFLEYDRVDDELRIFRDSTREQRFDETGIHTIGGLSVGNANSSTIADNEIEIGDLNFRLKHNAGNPIIQFNGADDHMLYTRASNLLDWSIASAVRMRLGTADLRLQNNVDLVVEDGGLAIGNFTPTNGRFCVGDTNFFMALVSNSFLSFDSGDFWEYDRTANRLKWNVTGAFRGYFDGTGLVMSRLAAGDKNATFSSPDPGGHGAISVKNAGELPAYFAFQETDLGAIGSYPEQYWRLRADSGDLVWEVNTHLSSPFSSVAEILRLQPTGGLSVSVLSTSTTISVGATLTAANITSSGGANFGGSFGGYLTQGIKVGDDDFHINRATAGPNVLPTIVFDATANDFLRYDRTDNELTMFVGGNEMFQFHPNTNAADVRFYLGDPGDKVFFETKTNEYGYAYSKWHLTDDGTYHDYIDFYKSGGTDLTWRFVEDNGVRWVMQSGVFRPASINYTLGSSSYEFATVYGRHYASNLSSAPAIGFHSERKSVYCGSVSVSDLPWLGTRAHHNQGTTDYKIMLGGDTTSTALSWVMYYTSSTVTNDLQGMTLNRMFRFEWTGDAYGDNWYTSGADLAEVWQKHEDDIEPGDVLVLHQSQNEHLGISQTPNDPRLAGVFSTKPGFTLDGTDRTLTRKSGVPLALVGKAPVKVCNENGPIRPGDPLTSASRPGYAMRAIRSGRILGRALEAFDRDRGQVKAFVNCQDWINPTEFSKLQEQVADLQRQLDELRGQP
jgi:hypothetical protein